MLPMLRTAACSDGIKQAGRQPDIRTATSRDLAPPAAPIAPAVTLLPARDDRRGRNRPGFDGLPGLDDDSEDPDRSGGGCSRRRCDITLPRPLLRWKKSLRS